MAAPIPLPIPPTSKANHPSSTPDSAYDVPSSAGPRSGLVELTVPVVTVVTGRGDWSRKKKGSRGMPSPTQVGLRMLFAASQVKVVNQSIFVGFVALMLVSKITCANAQQFGTAEEARAMLDRAVAALRSDQIKALREFNDADNKEFHDRDLYVSCFNIADGVFTAAPSAMVGMDIRSFNVSDDPIGQKAFDAIQGTPEGNVVTMDFNFPKAGKPAVKQSL